MIHQADLALSTRGDADIHDLTDQVDRLIAASGLHEGLVTLFTPSSTSALTTIEFEQGALDDLRRALDQIAPPDGEYRHNLRWGDGNGHAHLRAALLGPSLAIPIRGGQMTLGTWQQIIFIDFDVRPRRRTVIVQIIGDSSGEDRPRRRRKSE
ncbi:MAG TPA: secondary thiamine-phosphate synthase enzyme YjbQ [Anaerolineales bacterium]|nr:secondary thiamine-phosphate synthase enzyme YjbQ [Anaerolineales bacterium]